MCVVIVANNANDAKSMKFLRMLPHVAAFSPQNRPPKDAYLAVDVSCFVCCLVRWHGADKLFFRCMLLLCALCSVSFFWQHANASQKTYLAGAFRPFVGDARLWANSWDFVRCNGRNYPSNIEYYAG